MNGIHIGIDPRDRPSRAIHAALVRSSRRARCSCGLVGGVLTGLLYARRAGLPVWRVADAAAPSLILGQAVGRLARIPNGDAYGAPTTLPWAFVYTNPASMVPPELLGKPFQPYPAYEMIFDLTLLGLLWRLRELGRPRPRILAPERDKFRASKDGEGGG